jgi:hypothetical protein
LPAGPRGRDLHAAARPVERAASRATSFDRAPRLRTPRARPAPATRPSVRAFTSPPPQARQAEQMQGLALKRHSPCAILCLFKCAVGIASSRCRSRQVGVDVARKRVASPRPAADPACHTGRAQPTSRAIPPTSRCVPAGWSAVCARRACSRKFAARSARHHERGFRGRGAPSQEGSAVVAARTGSCASAGAVRASSVSKRRRRESR